MPTRTLCITFISALWLSVPAAEPWQQGIDSAVCLLASQRYDEAEDVLDELQQLRPAHPAVLYQRLAVRQTRIVDYESYPFEAQGFLAFSDSTIKALTANLGTCTGTDSLECLFYLGNAWGAVGLMHAKLGNWFAGVGAAVRSKDMLSEVLRRDSLFYAAQLGVGMFNYYLGQGLKWIPFVVGRRDEGLQQIEAATRARFPYDMAARNTLCWILIERDQYRRADSVCQEALEKMPRNTIFVKAATCIASWTHNHDEAVRRGRELVELSLARTPVNWNDVFTGYRAVAEAFYKQDRMKECREAGYQALAYEVPAQYLQISYVREHRARLAELVKDKK